jgi:hypothetical protein
LTYTDSQNANCGGALTVMWGDEDGGHHNERYAATGSQR